MSNVSLYYVETAEGQGTQTLTICMWIKLMTWMK